MKVGVLLAIVALGGVRYRLGHRGVGHARLHHGAAILIVHLQNPIHPRQPEQNSVPQGQGAARQRRPRASGHDPDVLLRGISEHLRNLAGVRGQHANQRPLAVGAEGVAVIGGQRCFVGDGSVGHDDPHRGGDFGAAREGAGIGCGQLDHARALLT